MITAVIIDDDQNIRSGMKGLLSLFAPEINVVAEAFDVESGIAAIENFKPQIIFLDIQFKQGSGFDILEQLASKKGRINSHIVFITAHEEYAIKAFRFSALDFLLKPVNPEELKNVIAKIHEVSKINHDFMHIDLLLENINKKVDNYKRIALSNSDGMHLFEISDIIRCESDGNYTKFYIKKNQPVIISKTLKEYEDLLKNHGFLRVHQSHLINIRFLKSYVKKDGGYVIMTDDHKLPISHRKKDYLQEILNKELNN
jgi:two-component system, LytTR family, response regulator